MLNSCVPSHPPGEWRRSVTIVTHATLIVHRCSVLKQQRYHTRALEMNRKDKRCGLTFGVGEDHMIRVRALFEKVDHDSFNAARDKVLKWGVAMTRYILLDGVLAIENA